MLAPDFHKKTFEGRQPAKVCADALAKWAARYQHEGFGELAGHDFGEDVARLQAGLAAAFEAGHVAPGQKAALLTCVMRNGQSGVLVRGAARLSTLYDPAACPPGSASNNGSSPAHEPISLSFLEALQHHAEEWAAEPCPRKKRARKKYQAVLEILETTAAQLFICAAVSAICRDGRRANAFLFEGRKHLALAVQCGAHEPLIIGRIAASGWTAGAKLSKQRKHAHLRVAREGADAIARWRLRYPTATLNLKGADLREADLRNADLSGARIAGANLTNARLDGANLERADLQEAILDGATFDRAQFHRTSLLWVSGKGTTFREALIDRSYFGGATLSGADFSGAQIATSSFVQSRLVRGTRFNGARLRDVDFSGARRITADFSDATLDEVCFEDAQIKGATFDSEAATALELEPVL